MKITQFLILSLLFLTINLWGNENPKKALVTFKKGNVFFIRENQTHKIHINTILTEKDIIRTEKNSSVNIQFSDGVIIMIGPQTQLEIHKLMKENKKDEVRLKQSTGEILAKVSSKKNTQLDIESPTTVASVRGTELLINSDQNTTTVAVNEGKVEVSRIDGSQKETIEAGQKIMVTFQEMKKSILEIYEKDKFHMIQELEKTKKQNLENLIQQIEKDQKMLQEQKQRIQIPPSPLEN